VRLTSNLSRPLAAVLLAALLVTTPAVAATPSSDARSTTSVVDVSRIRIDNFGRVNANYFRGAQPNGRDYADLAALGVKAIINLTSDDAEPDEKVFAKNNGLKYFEIPMTTHAPPTPEKLAAFLSLVDDPANQPVYVHCVGGRHRTGVMTAVYRMTEDGWSADQAFNEMKQYKFGADFLHSEFKRFVYGYRVDLADKLPAPAVTATGKTQGTLPREGL
jgi:tyrosine-protein phosphatase SIW14